MRYSSAQEADSVCCRGRGSGYPAGMSELQDAAAQHSVIGNAGAAGTGKHVNRHPEAQWFASAGLGLFIHFGITSTRGIGDLSWSMMWQAPGARAEAVRRYGFAAAQVLLPPEDYWAQAATFAPDAWDPDAILAAAKAAGCTYAVLTTKHHDGFTLWPSGHGDLGVHSNGFGRDLVRPFTEACRRHGLKVGLYYSPPDWWVLRHHMGFPGASADRPARGLRHEILPRTPEPDAAATARWHSTIRGHLEELLTGYGRIDLLWLDGSAPGAFDHAWLRAFQPHLVINRRQAADGDFDTPECSYPKTRPDGWWEYCHIWNDGAWAYLRHEIYKPTGWMLSELAKARAWGGNLLINVGPDGRGRLPAAGYQRLADVAAWMAHSRTSVFGVEAGPWPERASVPVTVRDDIWYLHALWDHDGEISVSGTPDPHSCRLLRDGQQLTWRRRGDQVVIDLPPRLRTALDDVIELGLGSATAAGD
jgi:alpha-L-fucosidase